MGRRSRFTNWRWKKWNRMGTKVSSRMPQRRERNFIGIDRFILCTPVAANINLDHYQSLVWPQAWYNDCKSQLSTSKFTSSVRPIRFHYPAAADRILIFQPRGGAVDHIHIDQLEITPIPTQIGSDHKPIAIKFDLYVYWDSDIICVMIFILRLGNWNWYVVSQNPILVL